MPPIYFLTTDRLGFRKWNKADLHLAKDLWGDHKVTRLIDARGQLTAAQIKEKLNFEIQCEKTHGVQYWPVFLRKTGAHIGCCGLRPYDLHNNIYELGFHIKTAHWRKGYASEAAKAVIGHALNTIKAANVFAGHHPRNEASGKMLLKLGFTYIKDEYYDPTGLYHPSYLLKKEEQYH